MTTQKTVLLLGAAALASVYFLNKKSNQEQQLQYAQQYQQQNPATKNKVDWSAVINAISKGIDVFAQIRDKKVSGIGTITLNNPEQYLINTGANFL